MISSDLQLYFILWYLTIVPCQHLFFVILIYQLFHQVKEIFRFCYRVLSFVFFFFSLSTKTRFVLSAMAFPSKAFFCCSASLASLAKSIPKLRYTLFCCLCLFLLSPRLVFRATLFLGETKTGVAHTLPCSGVFACALSVLF